MIDKAVFNRIGVDAAEVEEVGIGSDVFCLKWAFEQGSGMGISFVICFGIAVENGLYQCADRLFCFLAQKEMVMVGK